MFLPPYTTLGGVGCGLTAQHSPPKTLWALLSPLLLSPKSRDEEFLSTREGEQSLVRVHAQWRGGSGGGKRYYRYSS